MKRITLSILSMIFALGISLNGTASPLPTRCQVLVYIPFSFQVAGSVFPAGYYRFEQVLGDTVGVEVLVVRSLDSRFYQAVATKAELMDETQVASKIVFRRSGDKLVLAEVCSSSKHAALKLYGERAMEQTMTARVQSDDEVVVLVPSGGEMLAMAKTAK